MSYPSCHGHRYLPWRRWEWRGVVCEHGRCVRINFIEIDRKMNSIFAWPYSAWLLRLAFWLCRMIPGTKPSKNTWSMHTWNRETESVGNLQHGCPELIAFMFQMLQNWRIKTEAQNITYENAFSWLGSQRFLSVSTFRVIFAYDCFFVGK